MDQPYEALIKFTKALADAPLLAVKYIIEHETDAQKKAEIKRLAESCGLKIGDDE